VYQISVDQTSDDLISVDQMTVYQIYVNLMLLGQMSADQISADQMSVDQMSTIPMLVNIFFSNLPGLYIFVIFAEFLSSYSGSQCMSILLIDKMSVTRVVFDEKSLNPKNVEPSR
jgi:hypothetical protein